MERATPELNGLVVSGAQFGREDDLSPGVSRELMCAVRRQAAQRTAGLDFDHVTRQAVLRGAAARCPHVLPRVTEDRDVSQVRGLQRPS